MRLSDFEPIGDNATPRFVTRVEDVGGDETFELTIAGDEALVSQVLDDATIELTIDSSRSDKDVTRELDAARVCFRQTMWDLAALDHIDDLFKPDPPRPRREATVVAAVRPLSGHGTFFDFSFSNIGLGRGASAWCLVCPWVNLAFGTASPISGDQDLFLYLFKPGGPLVSASTFPGTTMDFVAFGAPLPFVPVFEWRGFVTGRGNGRCMGF